jgi:hypothetical protein
MPHPATFISKPPLSPQLSCAQNASRGASMVNNQTAASKVTSAATATTPSNSTWFEVG